MAINSNPGQTSTGGPSQLSRPNQPETVLDGGQLARVIVRIAGLGSGPWLLALERTCWKFGRHEVNILMLAIIHSGDVGRSRPSRDLHHGSAERPSVPLLRRLWRGRHRWIDRRSGVHRHGLDVVAC